MTPHLIQATFPWENETYLALSIPENKELEALAFPKTRKQHLYFIFFQILFLTTCVLLGTNLALLKVPLTSGSKNNIISVL